MPTLQLDIVSDISCPWCIVGYSALQIALKRLKGKVDANVTWHAFELNPQMPPEGQDVNEYMMQKYGLSEEKAEQNREQLKQAGLAVGYEFGLRGGGLIYNTFDAHRLLCWAKEPKEQKKQTELKLALFDLYFKNSGNPSDHVQLLKVVKDIGLEESKAKKILESQDYAQDVRADQKHYHSLGIKSVPAVIVNNKHLISGGQPADAFEQTLLELSKEIT